MMRSRSVFASIASRAAFTSLALSLIAAPVALGGFLENVGVALQASAFDVRSRPNPLSGGRDVFIGRTFVGNQLDFGPWDLTLQGPISMQVATGGRRLSELEVSFTTAANSSTAVQPLNYVLNVDSGGQETQVSGSLLIDGDLRFNGFGFYEVSLSYSSRQNVVRDGRFANDEREFDSDIGPIVVSGNIVADVLAILTEPFFQATGASNIFAEFSGRAKLSDAIALSLAELQGSLAEGMTADELAASTLAIELTPTSPLRAEPPVQGVQVVPEPPILILLLLGLPVLLARRRTSDGRQPLKS